MSATPNPVLLTSLFAALIAAPGGLAGSSHTLLSVKQDQSAPSASRHIGALKAISGSVLTLTPDSGADIAITVDSTTRIVRIAPGEKDLKNAVPMQLPDLQVGDRILAAGKPSTDASFVASSIVVMKRSDLQARQQQDLQDWQKRGVDGLAKSVDAAAGTVTISVRSKELVIHTSGNTVIRRYSPDSIKFDDAKASKLQEIHSGDQVRARGERSADGTALTAEEIVSGAFPLFAGTVNAVDASTSTVSVHDLSSKKNIVVKVTPESQLRHLPAEMAQRIAARLKGEAAGAAAAAPAAGAGSGNGSGRKDQSDAGAAAGSAEGGMASRRSGMGGRSGAPDMQQFLNRAPATSVGDLHKGDAVVILSTEGKAGNGTVLELFSGVEPILQAAPNAAQAMMLAPWSLGAPSADSGGP